MRSVIIRMSGATANAVDEIRNFWLETLESDLGFEFYFINELNGNLLSVQLVLRVFVVVWVRKVTTAAMSMTDVNCPSRAPII
ncbi:hypothetical protein TNIN_6461 [Trichonephila inaurata madagascariensis]|uniref:Uncharacterized protein n=1 Tax=Trichonephila inaurata madagascariensis TaxID=2747483 RepID=A0A8X6X3F5_9ARAC|nr:hypothetical protein TNIN_6461 [Trichonephila inaurata madagascariensis]